MNGASHLRASVLHAGQGETAARVGTGSGGHVTGGGDPLAREHTNRVGVGIVQMSVHRDLRWIFREQPTTDTGIDAQVEVAIDGVPTGRLIALQIKSGPSWFDDESDGGWTFRFDDRLAHLWLGHALPVMVVLVDTDAGTAFWQQVTASTVQSTGIRNKILIPRRNSLAAAAIDWGHVASGLEQRSADRYESALAVLPPSTVELLDEMHDRQATDAAVLAVHLAEGRSNPGAICRALLTASPAWLVRGGGAGWRVVGSYASEHNELSISADSLERAAGQDEARRGRLLAAAGLNAMQDDPTRSRRLLLEAQFLPGTQLLVAIGWLISITQREMPHRASFRRA